MDHLIALDSIVLIGSQRANLNNLLASNSTQNSRVRNGISSVEKSRKLFSALSYVYNDSELASKTRRKSDTAILSTSKGVPKSSQIERADRVEIAPRGTSKEEGTKEGIKEGIKEGTKEGMKEGIQEGTKVGATPWGIIDSVELLDNVLHAESVPWTQIQDEALVMWVETIARTADISPLNIDLNSLLSSRDKIGMISNLAGRQRLDGQDLPEVTINDVFLKHTDESIQVRVVLLLHLNDLLLPLLPLVSAVDGTDVSLGGRNHPTHLLKELRHLVFLSVVSEYTHKICSAVGANELNDVPTSKESVVSKVKVPGHSPSPAFSPSPSHVPTPMGTTAFSTTYSSFSSPRGTGQHSFPIPRISPAIVGISSSTILQSLAQPIDDLVEKSKFLAFQNNLNIPDKFGRKIMTYENETVLGSEILVLEVEDEISMAQKVAEENFSNNKWEISDCFHARKNAEKNFPSFFTTPNSELDIFWNVKFGFHCSLVGQMMTYFESLSEDPGSANSTKAINREIKNESYTKNSWENILRSVCSRNILWIENVKSKSEDQKVPFYIRTKKSNKCILTPSRLFSILSLAENSSTEDFYLADKSGKSRNGISQRNIFTVFVSQALEQVRQ